MNIAIVIIVALELSLFSSAVISRLQANQISDINNETGKSESVYFRLYIGKCTNYNETTEVRYEGYCPYIFKLDRHIFIDRFWKN